MVGRGSCRGGARSGIFVERLRAAGRRCAETALLLAILFAVFGGPFSSGSHGASPSAAEELQGRRTEFSTTYRNGDGTLTTHLYADSVNYRDGSEWTPIDDTLTGDANGYAVVNRANRFHAHFKDALDDDYLKLDVGDASYTLSAIGAARAALSSHDSSATYGGAFDGVDLRYDIQPDSVKETIVLQRPNAPSHFRFFLAGGGKALEANPVGDGSWTITGGDRDIPAFTIDAPVVQDAAGAVAQYQQGGDGPVTLDVTKTGDRYAIDIAVSERWLHDGARTFPVQIDPTLTIQPPVQNGSWNQSCSTCASTVQSGGRLPIGWDGTKSWRAGLLFDLGSIPTGANISDAELKVYYDGTCLGTGGCPTSALQLNAHKMTSFWTTGTTTPNVSFDSTPLASATLAAGAAAQWLQWNVTKTVDNWRLLQDTNFGFLIKSNSEGSVGGISVPAASYANASLTPRLDVTYVDDGLELQPPNTLHSNGADLIWRPFVDPNGAAFDRYDVYRAQGQVTSRRRRTH